MLPTRASTASIGLATNSFLVGFYHVNIKKRKDLPDWADEWDYKGEDTNSATN